MTKSHNNTLLSILTEWDELSSSLAKGDLRVKNYVKATRQFLEELVVICMDVDRALTREIGCNGIPSNRVVDLLSSWFDHNQMWNERTELYKLGLRHPSPQLAELARTTAIILTEEVKLVDQLRPIWDERSALAEDRLSVLAAKEYDREIQKWLGVK